MGIRKGNLYFEFWDQIMVHSFNVVIKILDLHHKAKEERTIL